MWMIILTVIVASCGFTKWGAKIASRDKWILYAVIWSILWTEYQVNETLWWTQGLFDLYMRGH
jgi:hypothetical protein